MIRYESSLPERSSVSPGPVGRRKREGERGREREGEGGRGRETGEEG
jgi:hypothetical protein